MKYVIIHTKSNNCGWEGGGGLRVVCRFDQDKESRLDRDPITWLLHQK